MRLKTGLGYTPVVHPAVQKYLPVSKAPLQPGVVPSLVTLLGVRFAEKHRLKLRAAGRPGWLVGSVAEQHEMRWCFGEVVLEYEPAGSGVWKTYRLREALGVPLRGMECGFELPANGVQDWSGELQEQGRWPAPAAVQESVQDSLQKHPGVLASLCCPPSPTAGQLGLLGPYNMFADPHGILTGLSLLWLASGLPLPPPSEDRQIWEPIENDNAQLMLPTALAFHGLGLDTTASRMKAWLLQKRAGGLRAPSGTGLWQTKPATALSLKELGARLLDPRTEFPLWPAAPRPPVPAAEVDF